MGWFKRILQALTTPTAKGFERILLQQVTETAVGKYGHGHAKTTEAIQAVSAIVGESVVK
ncbi:MAG TPA: hypothetical protein VKA04_11000 [Pseudodesulfovibrio sp.]|nr:hypothetical protein [Pseudodesulfovibrio sp.]